LHDIYPDLSTNANKPQHHLHHHSGNGLSAAPSTSSTASSSARPAYPSSYYGTKRPTHYSGSNPYKPGSSAGGSSRPSSSSSSSLNSWEHETGGHLGSISGITNHLDSFFDAESQAPLDSAGAPPPHEPLPNAQAFAVGNVLDLNAGEAADEYQSGGSGGYHDASYRPVPGTKPPPYHTSLFLWHHCNWFF